MRVMRMVGLGLLACAVVPAGAETETVKADLRQVIASARDSVYPALVHIGVVWGTEQGGHQVRFRATGSGTILDAQGTVLTNHHVAGKATRIICTLANKEEIPAELVGTDAMTDLAVLRLKLSERKDPKAPLPVAVLGDSDALKEGDYVLAMGSPEGMARSVTLGIVSNRERTLGGGMNLEGEVSGVLTRWIQHDALILPGNSGGPLVNLKGEVVGVNELGGSGVGFAIPSNLARTVLAEILKHGRVPRAWLGVEAQTLLKNSGEEEGVLVGSVEPGSPALAAGILPGDILLSFDGAPVTARFDEEIPLFYRKVAETPPGKDVEVVLRRRGAGRTLRITLGEDEPERGRDHEVKRLGITVGRITRAMARTMHLPDTAGVFVSGVQQGGPAGSGKPPLQGGDILRSVGGKPVAAVKDLTDWLETVPSDEKRTAVAEVERRGARVLSVVVVEPKEEEPQGSQIAKAWLGCDTQVLTAQLAEALGLAGTKGVRVTQVHPESPAEQAGLKVGDLVIQLGDQPVNAFREGHGEVFAEMVRRRKIGERTVLKLVRDGKPQDLEVTLGSSPLDPKDAKRSNDEDFEFAVREITYQDRLWNRWGKDVAGCVVERVEGSGWAGFAGMESGDLVLRIGETEIRDLDALKKALEDLKQRKPSQVSVMIRRGPRTAFLSLEPQWED